MRQSLRLEYRCTNVRYALRIEEYSYFSGVLLLPRTQLYLWGSPFWVRFWRM